MKRRQTKDKKGTQPDQPVEIPERLPVLAARDVVGFPGVMMSLFINREQSIQAIQSASERDGLVLVLAQKNPEPESPSGDDLFRVGVVAQVARALSTPDGRLKVFLQGLARATVRGFPATGKGLTAQIEVVSAPPRKPTMKERVLMERLRTSIERLVEKESLPEEMVLITEQVSDPGTLADIIFAHYQTEPARAQRMLEEFDAAKRLVMADERVTEELNSILLSEQMRDKTRDELDKGQREYFLREQLKQIQRELGDNAGPVEDIAQLRDALRKVRLPKEAEREVTKQLRRLELMSPEAGEYSLLRTYLEWFADLPWSESTKDELDIARAREILEEDHYGLEKVKERILEYLSVRKLNPATRGPILCFVGPPGVGKTSLGRSIARALGRKFVRLSLGGVRDEAEIRGHRRTYVGALPGRIVQGLKQAGSRNPVFVLDELDKIGADFRGDPAAALLEVLDPQQNSEFRDHYLGVPFDLSEVLFVATANMLDTIPEALLDRLEVISISGYTTEEKLQIANRYLIPRQQKENGLAKVSVSVQRDAVQYLVERYTREAGVRNLEREIGSVFRKLAREKAEGRRHPSVITPTVVTKLLGVTKFDPEDLDRREAVGLARGLAWTSIGGEVMPVEASVAKGTGQLTLTGQLGEVMQESAKAALFFARANARRLGLDEGFHSSVDIHVHVPSGATPKDGPSAGITIASALVSALSGRKISREIAMTGEITLRGNVLQIGGLKEKALAALRQGIKKVIIPFDNLKDLDEIPEEQREKLTFLPVRHVNEVLDIVLKETVSDGRSKRRGRRAGVAVKVS